MLGLFVMMAFVSTTRECTGLAGVADIVLAGAGLKSSTTKVVVGATASAMVIALSVLLQDPAAENGSFSVGFLTGVGEDSGWDDEILLGTTILPLQILGGVAWQNISRCSGWARLQR